MEDPFPELGKSVREAELRCSELVPVSDSRVFEGFDNGSGDREG